MFKSIVCTYPDFRELPKGLKQMLLASENLFFSEATATPRKNSAGAEKRFWQPGRFFVKHRESLPAQSRAFRWEFREK